MACLAIDSLALAKNFSNHLLGSWSLYFHGKETLFHRERTDPA
jgi:hypothetical protein